jgi:hypothetical protein
MINTTPFEVSDYSGGITDNYIEGDPNRARYLDNFSLTTNRKLYSRPGSYFFDENNPQVPSGVQRILSLINFDEDTLLFGALRKIYYIDGSFTPLLGPSGNDVLTNGDSSNETSNTYWNDHILITNDAFSIPMKIYRDQSGDLQVRNAGLPGLASDPIITVGGGDVFGYIYAFAYYYEYTSGQLGYIDIGPTTEVLVTNSNDPGINPNIINGIPVITPDLVNNLDTASIKVKIYRTVADGDILYEIGEVNNGTTTFNDNIADSVANLNQTIYTTGDVFDNDPPPRCKYVHVTNSIGLYAHVKDSNDNIFNNRVLMSIRSDIDSVPEGNIIDLDDEITGINSFEHIPIVFCKRHIYRIDGFYAPDGTGDPLHQRINDTVGCISNNSIVQTPYGTFFAGNDGFYWTDSFKVRKVSNEFNERYATITANSRRIYGTYDELQNIIYWSVKRSPTADDVDTLFALDLRFFGEDKNGVFTTWSGGNNFSPTAITIFNNELVRGDRRGYIFRHNQNFLTDPIIDTSTNPLNWEEATIIWDYVSCAFNFGTTFVRKWITRVNVICQNDTNLSLAIQSINDDGRRLGDLKPIRFRANVTWGDPDVVWGDPDIIWNFDGFIDEYRRFPAQNLRCNYKQIRFTNAFVITHNSDTYGEATVSNSSKNAVLADLWPETAVNYKIFFNSDNYEKGYDILSISGNTLTFDDPGNISPTGNYKWIIKGFPKGEVFSLVSYCLHYSLLSKTQEGFRSSGTGANA